MGSYWRLHSSTFAGGRSPKWERREIVNAILNAILYVLKTGCPWNMLPHDFPPYSRVFWYFRQGRKDGTGKNLNTILRERARQSQGREAQPSAAILDSQSVKTTEKGGKGLTVAKKLRGVNATLLSIPWAMWCGLL